MRLAKGCSRDETLREKIYSIKILCELLLEEEPKSEASLHTMKQQSEKHLQHQAVRSMQSKDVHLDDANGESLLDF